MRVERLLEVLRARADAPDDDDDGDPAASLKTFAGMRQHFLNEHEAEFHGAGLTNVTPAPLTKVVQDRFLENLQMYGRQALVLAYHGTAAHNHASIFKRGLLVPGPGTGVAIKHGNVHGRGIYVAKPDYLALSKGFLRNGARMLICGVIDTFSVPKPLKADAEEPAPARNARQGATFQGRALAHRCTRKPAFPQLRAATLPPTMGRFPLFGETAEVRHVGGAIVVRKNGYVAPLFTADVGACVSSTVVPARAVVCQDLLVPNMNRSNDKLAPFEVGRGRVLDPSTGDAVWLFGEAARGSGWINVKRRLNKRCWQSLRRAERAAKQKACPL